MKKLVLLALAAFALIASANTGTKKEAPIPLCNPCDMVR
jgi:hypothetical protein